jgi:hypothetical protein
MRTRRLATPDRATRHAFPVTFERDDCAPLRSGAGRQPGTSATRTSCPAARGPAAPRYPSVLEMGACPPRQRIEQFATGCLALLRPALRQYAEHEARCFRPTSASHCFDYEHSRPIRSQYLFEACASPLRPGLNPDDGDWGTWRFTTPDPLRRAVSGSRAAYSSACSRHQPHL